MDNRHNLQNSYFTLRHGKSVPNVEGIILSDPVDGISLDYGLVEEGLQQVQSAVIAAVRKGELDENVVIVSSDFSRAKQSAEIARQILSCQPIIFDPRLRERFFGKYERGSNQNYQKVWDLDVHNPDHTEMGVESANAVQRRFWELIMDCERDFSDQKIVLASHGDTLQIGETAFRQISAAQHRAVPHLQTAEIRKLYPRI